MLGNARFFVRDDDIGELTDALKFFVTLFISHRVPVSYQVIPHRLTSECAEYLRSMIFLHPELVEIGQHGFRHEMTKNGKLLKREFGPEKDYFAQAEDITRGKAILMGHFGEAINVFTPPQHKFNANTIRAAAASGYRVFSAASYSTIYHRAAYSAGRYIGMSSICHHGISYHGRKRPEADIFELSIAIPVDDGRTIKADSSILGRSIREASRYTEFIGLMFHHEVYASLASRTYLVRIVEQLVKYCPDNFSRLTYLALQGGSVSFSDGRIGRASN